MKFINDQRVIGKWQNIGWLDLNNTYLNSKDGDYEEIYFLENGEPYWIFAGWTKGILTIHEGGDTPVLSYKYEIKEIKQKEYLYLYLEDKVEVFQNINHQSYDLNSIGRHDNIDLPFINDPDILGRWKACGFVDTIDSFKEDNKQNDWALSKIEFLLDGSLNQYYLNEIWKDKWTKGYVLSLHRKTAAKYVIQKIKNKEYLFVEWKMGNYIYGGFPPAYYVFEKEK